MKTLAIALTMLIAGCSGGPAERFRFECPGQEAFTAVEDPGAGWIKADGRRVYPEAKCKKTPAA